MSDAQAKIKQILTGWLTADKPDSRGMDILYFVTLAAYLTHFQCKFLSWTQGNKVIGDVGAMLLLDTAFLALLVYTSWGLLRRMPKFRLVLVYAAAAGVLLRFWPGLEYEVRCWIVNLFLIGAARGRNFRGILRTYGWVFAGCILAAVLGLLFGYTYEHYKWQGYGTGLAFGYSNANNLSRLVLWIAMVIWLLRWKESDLGTVLCFGAVAAFSAFLTVCRTVTVMALLIPAAAVLSRHWKPWRSWGPRGLRCAAVCAGFEPFFFLLLSLALSFAVVPLIPYFRESDIWNLLVRFIQNNIALQEYGVHLTGRGVDFLGSVSRVFYGEEIHLLILDNAYVPWLIRNGVIRTVLLLGLLSASMVRCVKNRDRTMLIAFSAILLYGLMEPASVQVHYNFAFLYLLTGNGTKKAEASHPVPGEESGSD